MAKNDNAHAIRFADSLRAVGGDNEAETFAGLYPLSKSADIEKKFQWAQNVCAYLEERFDAETIIRIRKDCRCNDGSSIAKKLLKYWKASDSTEQFVEAFNQKETFAALEYIAENRIRFCYPECYCACVKRVPGSLPKTWCYCTMGNAEGIFRVVFGESARVSLIETIKSGAARCVMEVEW